MSVPTPQRRGLAALRAMLERLRQPQERPTEAWGVWSPVLAEWFNPGGARPYVHTREAAAQHLRRARMSYPTGEWVVAQALLDDSGTAQSS